MSFLDHLEELRWHLVRAGISIVVFAVAAFVAKTFVWHDIILAPSRTDFWTYRMLCQLGELTGSSLLCIEELPFIIQSRQMTGQFTMHLGSSLVIGLICAFPYTFWEIWRFVSPGLHITERRISRGATFFVSLLFLAGVLFGYFIISPIAINFLANYQVDPSIYNEIDIISYVTTLIMIVLAAGIMFQLPVVVYFLTKAGLVTPQLMRTYRKHSIVVILVVSAIITPPDVVSQVLIGLPLMLLYEISIFISRALIRKRVKKITTETSE